jgi:hypothetical protein
LAKREPKQKRSKENQGSPNEMPFHFYKGVKKSNPPNTVKRGKPKSDAHHSANITPSDTLMQKSSAYQIPKVILREKEVGHSYYLQKNSAYQTSNVSLRENGVGQIQNLSALQKIHYMQKNNTFQIPNANLRENETGQSQSQKTLPKSYQIQKSSVYQTPNINLEKNEVRQTPNPNALVQGHYMQRNSAFNTSNMNIQDNEVGQTYNFSALPQRYYIQNNKEVVFKNTELCRELVYNNQNATLSDNLVERCSYCHSALTYFWTRTATGDLMCNACDTSWKLFNRPRLMTFVNDIFRINENPPRAYNLPAPLRYAPSMEVPLPPGTSESSALNYYINRGFTSPSTK